MFTARWATSISSVAAVIAGFSAVRWQSLPRDGAAATGRWVRRRQPARRHPDDLLIRRLTDRVIDFRAVEIGDAAVQPRFGLRDVRRRHIPGVVALVGCLQHLAQKLHVDFLRLHQRLIGDDAHVRRHRIKQDVLFDAAQLLAARPGPALQPDEPDYRSSCR